MSPLSTWDFTWHIVIVPLGLAATFAIATTKHRHDEAIGTTVQYAELDKVFGALKHGALLTRNIKDRELSGRSPHTQNHSYSFSVN